MDARATYSHKPQKLNLRVTGGLPDCPFSFRPPPNLPVSNGICSSHRWCHLVRSPDRSSVGFTCLLMFPCFVYDLRFLSQVWFGYACVSMFCLWIPWPLLAYVCNVARLLLRSRLLSVVLAFCSFVVRLLCARWLVGARCAPAVAHIDLALALCLLLQIVMQK